MYYLSWHFQGPVSKTVVSKSDGVAFSIISSLPGSSWSLEQEAVCRCVIVGAVTGAYRNTFFLSENAKCSGLAVMTSSCSQTYLVVCFTDLKLTQEKIVLHTPSIHWSPPITYAGLLQRGLYVTTQLITSLSEFLPPFAHYPMCTEWLVLHQGQKIGSIFTWTPMV